MTELLTLIHVLGLALGLGAATTKTVLLLRCGADAELIAAYLRVRRFVTRVIITGLALLVVSGAGFFLVGFFSLGADLIFKLVLVAALFVLGPVIDNVVEPRFAKAFAAESSASLMAQLCGRMSMRGPVAMPLASSSPAMKPGLKPMSCSAMVRNRA